MNRICPKCNRYIEYIGTSSTALMCTCNEGSDRYKEGYRDGYRDGVREYNPNDIALTGLSKLKHKLEVE